MQHLRSMAAIVDVAETLTRHGFSRLYFLNGHGGKIAPVTTAFSEIYAPAVSESAADYLAFTDHPRFLSWTG